MAKSPSKLSAAVYERLSATCLAFPGAEAKLSHGAPWFHVRGKMFLAFADEHHGDGRVAAWVKSTPEEQRRLVASDAARYFVPPYVGVKGWVGVRLDDERVDWIDLAILFEEAWRSVAPKRIAEGAERVKKGAPLELPKTDAAKAEGALDKLAALCAALPESVMDRQASHASFCVGKKTYAYFLDNHHGDERIAACVKAAPGESAKLAKRDPARFYVPDYLGSKGWVGVRLDVGRVDWDDVRARVAASYAMVAPRRLAAKVASR
jgi:hypothetical protein